MHNHVYILIIIYYSYWGIKMTIIEIAVSVIAVTFIVLVIYLARTLCAATNLLKSVQKQVTDLGHAPRNLVHNINEISRSFSHKNRMLDPFFNALSNVGEILEEKSERLSSTRRHINRNDYDEEEHSKTSDLVSWLLRGADLYKNLKKGR